MLAQRTAGRCACTSVKVMVSEPKLDKVLNHTLVIVVIIYQEHQHRKRHVTHPLSTPGGIPIDESKAFGKDPRGAIRSLIVPDPRNAKSASVNSGRCVTRRVTGIVVLVNSTVTVAGTTICKMELAVK